MSYYVKFNDITSMQGIYTMSFYTLLRNRDIMRLKIQLLLFLEKIQVLK